jgi:outer membrane protein OmpA-like peptidoglycan-associated protein
MIDARRSLLVAGLAISVTAGVNANGYAQATPSEHDFARALGSMGATRGLPTLGSSPQHPTNQDTVSVSAPSSGPVHHAGRSGPTNAAAAHPHAAAHPAISLPSIQFAFNSAELKPESIQTLRNLGNALNRELKGEKKFLIEGHTDAVGTEAYNIDLSKRRAEAVKDFLVDKLGVDASRLEAVGKGDTDPADPQHPKGPENRRVVIANLSRS